MKYSDSLRGYAFKIHQRDHFRCCYCGLDGTKSFANWLNLSYDHLLPHGDPRRETSEFIVTACMFCNTADNQYFAQAGTRNLSFENKSPDELVAQRMPYVLRTRNSYQTFWEENVRATSSSSESKLCETRQKVLEVGAEGETLVFRMGSGIPPTICSRIDEMTHSVQKEFGDKAGLFKPVVVRLDSHQGEDFDATKKPGVYVFLHEEHGWLKVGKSHLNASKRALEHCRDNTSSKDGSIQMANLRNSDKTYLLVFALQDAAHVHWVLALEHYLEKEFNPKIHSQRNG